MTSHRNNASSLRKRESEFKHPISEWVLLGLTFGIGLIGIRYSLSSLYRVYLADPLQSIGFAIVPTAFLLILREWKNFRWERRGTWWGLPVVVVAFVLSIFHSYVTLYWTGGGRAAIALLPYALPLFLYASGLVLLFVGRALWMAAWLPMLLLLFAKPVPIFFTTLLDLPLQHMTADVARAFATAIGLKPKTPELLLMFSPDFGMFIAPGCDGIRGAVTMGYLALVVGYFKRLRAMPWLLYVVGAVALGYLFNFVRICSLVIYYRLALGHPWWENEAKQADYAIGFVLFAVAAAFFAALVLRKSGEEVVSHSSTLVTSRIKAKSTLYTKCVAVLLSLGAFAAIYNFTSRGETGESATTAIVGERMPDVIGVYKLKKSWFENDGRVLANEDAVYESTSTGQQITLVMWMMETTHNIHDSWYARGGNAEARTMRSFVTANGTIGFDTGLYRDQNEDSLLLGAMCTPSKCSEPAQGGGHMGFVFSAPDLEDMAQGHGRLVPISVKITVPHSALQSDVLLQLLTNQARAFLKGLNTKDLSRRFQ